MCYLVSERPVKFVFRGRRVALSTREAILFQCTEEDFDDLREKIEGPLKVDRLYLTDPELTRLDDIALEVSYIDLDRYPDPDIVTDFIQDVSCTRGRLMTGLERATDGLRITTLSAVKDAILENRVPDGTSYEELYTSVKDGIEV